MSENNVAIAEAYYQAMGRKDLSSMEPYLDSKIHFIGPLSEVNDKDELIKATGRLFSLFNDLTIRAKLSSGDQAMIVYDLDCPQPIGKFRVASLMTFKNNLIKQIELFYDARPFDKKSVS